jgi:SAM-dependent methyltransferase
MTSIVDDRGYNQGFEWTKTQALRMERRARAIVSAAAVQHTDRIIELGCGTGELASLMAANTSARVTGVDICVPFIEQARQRFASPRLDFAVADLSKIEEIDRLGANFDAVVGNGILHHLYYVIDEALPRLRRLLKPGGRFVFFEPNLFNPYVAAIFSIDPLRKIAKLEPDEMAFTPRWIRERLGKAGFATTHVEFKDFLLPNLPWAVAPTVATVGDRLEKIPLIDHLAQSLFITAKNQPV